MSAEGAPAAPRPGRPGRARAREKGGLARALRAAELTAEDQVGWADERRVGLRGAIRRVWGRRGVPVRQFVQFTDEWQHLFVVVTGRAGRVPWAGLPSVQAEAIAAAVGGLGPGRTEVTAVVWDRAPGHRDERLRPFAREQGLAVIEQPPYAPELNPAARLMAEIRRDVAGQVYATREDKVAAWDWIEQALESLPALSPPIAA